MIYLKRLILTMTFFFLIVGYAAQNTMSPEPRTVNNKQQLIFQVMGDKLILYKEDIEKIQLQPQEDGQTQIIEIQFTDGAAKKFDDFSVRNSGQHMQIVWNGIVLTDAVIAPALPPPNGIAAGVPHVDSSVPPAKGLVVVMSDVDSSVVQEMVSSLLY